MGRGILAGPFKGHWLFHADPPPLTLPRKERGDQKDRNPLASDSLPPCGEGRAGVASHTSRTFESPWEFSRRPKLAISRRIQP
jgi:hypothetical protein